MEELSGENREIGERIRTLQAQATADQLNAAEMDALRQMLSDLRAGLEDAPIAEKRAAVCTVVRKVIWDGDKAHVVLFGAEEPACDFTAV